jgi:hypothetical protein
MTLDELITGLKRVREEAGQDAPVRFAVKEKERGDQFEVIHVLLAEGLESPMALVLAGRSAAEMDWPTE